MPRRLRVVHFLSDMGGGATRSALDLARATEGEVENLFVVLEARNLFPVEFPRRILVKRREPYRKLGRLGDRLLARKFTAVMRELEADLAVSHMEAAARVLSLAPVPRIYYIRTDLARELEQLRRRSRRRFLRRRRLYRRLFDGEDLLAVSRETGEKLSAFLRPRRLETLYTPFDFARIRRLAAEAAEIPQGEYLIQVGSDPKVKRPDLLLEAFALLKRPGLRLLFLGMERSPELEALRARLGIGSERVLYRSFAANPYPLIRHARLLVLSSEREGLPRVLVEALALGTPAVSTDCETGPREVLRGALERYLAPVDDAAALAERIEAALERYPAIGGEILAPFEGESIARRFLRFAEETIGRDNARTE